MELTTLQRQMLHLLLNKYESRSDYASAEKNPRRTMQAVNRKNYPNYFHVSDSRFRLSFNREMEALAAKGFVALDWVKFDRGNTLQRIILREENLILIYRLLNRNSKQEQYYQLADLFRKWQKQSPEILSPFYADMLTKIHELSNLPASVKQETVKDYEDLCTGLIALVTPRAEEVLKRQLSVSVYNNSK